MSVFRLVYCSRAAGPQTLATLTAITDVARARNERDGLTGVPCYCAPHFFQCLEGPRDAVSRTLGRIYRDPRHTDLLLVDARFVPARAFPPWGMELVTPGQLPAGLVAAVFDESSGEHGPPRLVAERLLNFLEQVSRGTAPPPVARPRRGHLPPA